MKAVIKTLEVVLSLAIIVTGVILYTWLDREHDASVSIESLAHEYTGKDNNSNSEPAETDAIAVEPEEPVSISADFEALRAVNKEIVGWVKIPGTEISHPVLQAADNQKYLNLNYDGTYLYCGSVFMDWRVDTENSNALLMYGHNMGRGKKLVFSELANYENEDYFKEHPEVLLAIDDGTANGNEQTYQIFSVCIANSKKNNDIESFFSAGNLDREGYESYIRYLYDNSIYGTGHSEIPDKVVALATCDRNFGADARMVVYAGLFSQREDESNIQQLVS